MNLPAAVLLAAACALAVAAQTPPPSLPASAPPAPQPAVVSGERWKLQYFLDESKRSIQFSDIAFPSARRGVAVGSLVSQTGGVIGSKVKVEGVAVVTADGGQRWTLVPLKEVPISTFFLNESLGWVVTPEGVWRTDESGVAWKKIWGQRGVLRVWFVNENRGFAVGFPKKIWETSDGGRKWKPLAAVEEVKSREEYTAFRWIAFHQNLGIIIGQSRPPRRIHADVPRWADPEDPDRLREWPALTVMLQTLDGGKTWRTDTGSVFGNMTRVRGIGNDQWYGMLEYREEFEFPSEFYALTGKGVRTIFREKDRQLTDFWLTPGGVYLASVAVPGKLAHTPVPTKIRMFFSSDLKLWREIRVDYRAQARNVVLAGSPDGAGVWAATDEGMILHLEKE